MPDSVRLALLLSLSLTPASTAFILYLFEAIRAVFFNQRPDIQINELHLPLPCHEAVFAATSEQEWQELCKRSQILTSIEYPAVLSVFLCQYPVDVQFHFSIMGLFVVLHGRSSCRAPKGENLYVNRHPATYVGTKVNPETSICP
jgi:hypothetical protein